MENIIFFWTMVIKNLIACFANRFRNTNISGFKNFFFGYDDFVAHMEIAEPFAI